MRTHTRAIIPFLLLMYALRLWWAEPRILLTANSVVKRMASGFFVAPAACGRRHPAHTAQRRLGSRLLPWAHALPLDGPAIHRRRPRVRSDVRLDMGTEGCAVSASLWKDCQLEAMRSLHHPWTLGLATGTTSRASFKKYVAQDAYFLRAFAKAYAYALVKVEDEGGVRAFHSLIGSVLEELSLHASYSVKWGLDLKNPPPPVQATTEYVDFLLAVASDPTSSVAQVLASMVPCMRLYAFIGKELREAFPGWRESVYAEWIDTYSSSNFENAAVLVETLLDQYTAEADYPLLLAFYRKAMQLELAFFDAQIHGSAKDDSSKQMSTADSAGVQSLKGSQLYGEGARGNGRFSGVHGRVSLLCVDFDDTLTDGDTTSLLVEAAKAQGVDQADVEHEWALLSKDFLSKWSEVIEESLSTKIKFDDEICAARSAEAVDRRGLEEMLRRLEAVDLDSVARVSGSKVLRGITRENIHSSLAGPLRSSWKVHPGMAHCMSHALASPFQTHVVSINWSRDVITTILSETLSDSPSSFSSAEVNIGENIVADEAMAPRSQGDWPPPVSSNDLVFDESGVSTGEIAMKVSGSFGKHQHFIKLAAAAREAVDGPEKSSRSITVYVGDSVTDLLAMLDADVGIVVGDSDTFEKVARAFGISIRPLASAYEALHENGEVLDQGVPDPARQCVYRVSQWAEIDVFLFGAD